ncbi:Hypothetical predicted protein [Paramuricea clavata]|uniref:Uncharacterized protein n=1 Tax=Paramuricea clavata TaxID=317549 RepID=A0A7D9E811_PARCT|nr:Hypothetical predicted protein [Paramuricea clavata]
MTSSGNDVFAEPMPEPMPETFLENYFDDLRELKAAGHLPSNFEEVMSYSVYSLRGSTIGAHKSIVLSPDDQHFFSIELGFTETVEDGVIKKRIYPATKKIDAKYKKNLVKHGNLKASTATLLAKGVATMRKFGTYFKYCNNCQNYCNYYLEVIGLGKTSHITDAQKIALGSLVLLITALLVKSSLKSIVKK